MIINRKIDAPQELINTIKELRENGNSWSKICKILKCSNTTLRDFCKEFGPDVLKIKLKRPLNYNTDKKCKAQIFIEDTLELNKMMPKTYNKQYIELKVLGLRVNKQKKEEVLTYLLERIK